MNTVLPVETTSENCRGDRLVQLSSVRGILANLVTEASGCGGARNPWVIQALPGQIISVTLLDFNVYNQKEAEGVSIPKRQVYAQIRERLQTGSRNVTVYGGTTRQTQVYTSTTNRVEVAVVMNEKEGATIPYFLLKYEGW